MTAPACQINDTRLLSASLVPGPGWNGGRGQGKPRPRTRALVGGERRDESAGGRPRLAPAHAARIEPCRALDRQAGSVARAAAGPAVSRRNAVDRGAHLAGACLETSARVALIESGTKRAAECIAKALSAIQGFEAPLAAWRVHATAAALYDREKSRELAERHRDLSRTTILSLADSLPQDSSLRKTFLSSRIVAPIIG